MAIAVDEILFKVTKLQRMLIVAAVCILLIVGFYFLVIADIQDQIAGLEKRIAQLNTDIKNQERVLAEGPKLKVKIQELEQKLQTMVASLPEKQDIELLLKKITDLLSESNLIATKFAPGQEQINEELYYATIPIQLSVRGDYSKQGVFLTSLNELPRIVNVPSIKLGKSAGLSSRENDLAKKLEVISLDAEISGVTYRRLSAEEQKAIAQKKAAQPRKR
ncbi:type 4a pilus biogenesis protein PilO [Desulfomonile tiedjei]|uniref:Tfp pilus assembly protein PilO n=1 Tax=Desulfomonile tiedjei (strain ATCC 49306 / DSM 6799 / DCB-1) TaxID=706587 RepID=I4CE93_DESTA|nr:type 4a pilus biogenesis protein PilO [Desulfomonile tiedjei]AFM27884.1 Tfp pilus assembly protein PilO [Desulfomonile tiedjei DSM 6799]